jgi:gamma-glutamylcyclotransferase (GGCT)/AIG2-like uncharacterized protein YtfP
VTVLLFSYGTLQEREVQLVTYGRELQGRPDTLAGYRLAELLIADPGVVTVSGQAVHPIARATGNPADRIPGMVFELSPDELAASDSYEVSDYIRVEVTLESGATAFAYVARSAAERH